MGNQWVLPCVLSNLAQLQKKVKFQTLRKFVSLAVKISSYASQNRLRTSCSTISIVQNLATKVKWIFTVAHEI